MSIPRLTKSTKWMRNKGGIEKPIGCVTCEHLGFFEQELYCEKYQRFVDHNNSCSGFSVADIYKDYEPKKYKL